MTPSALRFIFSKSLVVDLNVTEYTWSSAAISLSQSLTDSFSRMLALTIGRISFFWMKYLDCTNYKNRFSLPKGFSATYQVDKKIRNEKEMLEDVKRICNL